MWHILSHWWHEIWIALILALIFAVIADLVRIGSRVRSGLRHLKTKLSEISNARIKTRMEELGKEIEKYRFYAQSERGLYLYALRSLLVMLVLMGIAGGLFVAQYGVGVERETGVHLIPFAQRQTQLDM